MKFFQPQNTPAGAPSCSRFQVSNLLLGGPKPSACRTTASSGRVVSSRSRPVDHLQPELVQHQHLLRQVAVAGQVGQPGGHPVDLLDVDRADLAEVALVGPQPPLRVEGQPDVRLGEQVGVALGLGEEVAAARLQVEQDVAAGVAGGVHPRAQVLDRRLGGVVAVRARRWCWRPWR